jgi:hypothetical protein
MSQTGRVQKPMFRTEARYLDFLRLSAYLLVSVKKEYFLDPRQFALISCLHIILDSPVNPIRFTRSASYASKRL